MTRKRIKISKTMGEFEFENSNFEPSIEAAMTLFTKNKKDFSFFLILKRSGDGVLMMTYDLFCNKKQWLEDEKQIICKKCKKAFGFFQRRHHCRCCGQIFCSECLKYNLILSKEKNKELDFAAVQVFIEGFNCNFDKKTNSLILKICFDCFTTNLDQLLEDYNQGSFGVRQKKKKFSFTQSLLKQNMMQQMSVEMTEHIFSRMLKIDSSIQFSQNLVEDLINILFIEFEKMMNQNMDFETLELKNIIQIVRILQPDFGVSVFPGIILDIDTNFYLENSTKHLSFPTVILLKKNFQISSTDMKGNFRYFSLEDYEKNINENIENFKNIILSQTDKNLIVFSQYPLPAEVYFFLKKQKIDFVFPLKQQKIALIEKYIKSSLYYNVQKVKKEYQQENEFFEIIGFSGVIDLKQFIIDQRVFIKLFITKYQSYNNQFYTFSLKIKGPLDNSSKVLKNTIRQYLPALYHKFLEINLLENEIKSFKYAEKQKNTELINKFSMIKIQMLDQKKEQEKKFALQIPILLDLMDMNKTIRFYENSLSYMSSNNTHTEYLQYFNNLKQNEFILHDLVFEVDNNKQEFNSLFLLQEQIQYSYLSNLNLSKNNFMMMQCQEVKLNEIYVYGKNDNSIFRNIKQIFDNFDTRCQKCQNKQKNHIKIYYVNDKVIKLKNLKAKYITSEYLILDKNQFEDQFFNFNIKKQKVFKIPKQKNYKNFCNLIQTGIVCLDCYKIITNFFSLDYTYQQISFSLFLYFYSLQFDEKQTSIEVKDNNLLQERSFQYSNNTPQINPNITELNPQKQSEQCFHMRIGRVFLQQNNILTFENKQARIFTVLLKNDIPSQKINNQERIKFLKLLQQNYNLILEYYTFLMSQLAKHLLKDENLNNLKNSANIILECEQQLKGQQLSIDFQLKQNALKESNQNFLQYISEISSKLRNLENILNKHITINDVKIKIQDLNTIIELFPKFQIQKKQTEIQCKNKRENSLEPKTNQQKQQDIYHSEKNSCTHNESFSVNNEIPKISTNKISDFVFIKQDKMMYYENPVNQFAHYLSNITKGGTIFPLNDEPIEKQIELDIDKDKNIQRLIFEINDDGIQKFYQKLKSNSSIMLDLFKDYMTEKQIFNQEGKIFFYIKEFFPLGFQKLRETYRINIEYFYHSLSEIQNLKTSGGKSNSSFYLTQDNKYIIKKISKTEFKMFQSFCQDYLAFLQENYNQNRKSFLCLIYGLFKIKTQRFIIMENCNYFIQNSDNVIITYDLKGSTLKRFQQQIFDNQTRLDTNFKIERNGDPVYLKNEKIQDIFSILSRDTLFLQKKEIIDYSLLLILDVSEDKCYMKIIDYLRMYDFAKNMESKWKLIRNNDTPTIVETKLYRERFMNAMKQYFVYFNKQFNNQI